MIVIVIIITIVIVIIIRRNKFFCSIQMIRLFLITAISLFGFIRKSPVIILTKFHISSTTFSRMTFFNGSPSCH